MYDALSLTFTAPPLGAVLALKVESFAVIAAAPSAWIAPPLVVALLPTKVVSLTSIAQPDAFEPVIAPPYLALLYPKYASLTVRSTPIVQ